MLFNSVGFAIFLPVVFFAYWFLTNRNLKTQNLLLLTASYFFYACWDYRFLLLLVFSTLLDYSTGILIRNAKKINSQRFWLWLSIIVNLGFLGIFKYYNFFAASFASGLSLLGMKVNVWTISIILPVGISFYTFHGLSYVIDIYKKRITPERNFIDYSLFVSFFPLLVAGPIERATHLLPQIQKKRQFSYAQAVDGLRQILWGLFKKMVIADNCAEFANLIFNHASSYSGSTHIVGALFFAFQIYCDFSGYSDIALGTARLFGIELLRNFAFPYFSRDIAEFWRRWHISLSSWFRDYLYIPLGGSKGGMWMKIRNTFIIFLVSGFWHGANWTFIAWGALNAIYFLPLMLLKTNRNHLGTIAEGRNLPSVADFFNMICTFALTTFAWIFFRADTMGDAVAFVGKIFTRTVFTWPQVLPKPIILLVVVFMAIEWMGREEQYAIAAIGLRWPKMARWATYYGMISCILYFSGSKQQFIYFQF